ncbi:MAG: hypothetical protein D6765_06550 [Bacteroidetes bacterium]|nr:MAG: hypothetical protein D6765_06550 [Bacteroidota bacterium]
MKNWKFLLVALFGMGLLFSACNKAEDVLDDDDLAFAIATAENKEVVEPEALPLDARNHIEENYFETYIEFVHRVPDMGFEVILGDEEVLYFHRNGRLLNLVRRHLLGRGPCGRGEIIRPEDLPDVITSYIEDNYVDAEIKRAKQKPSGNYIVLITTADGRLLLIFDADGNFVEEATHFHHCRPLGHRIDPAELPDVITTFIEENYVDAEIKIAFKKINGWYIVGITTADGRKILVFDADGNLLFERP